MRDQNPRRHGWGPSIWLPLKLGVGRQEPSRRLKRKMIGILGHERPRDQPFGEDATFDESRLSSFSIALIG
jgi:hypothetical protein